MLEETSQREKNALQIHRCEHQIASISRLEEWRPRSPAGIQRDCFSSKGKTNILLARMAVHQNLKIETSFHVPPPFHTGKKCSYCSAALLQFKMFWWSRNWPKSAKAVFLSYNSLSPVCFCLLAAGFGVLPSSLCLIQHANRGSHTRKSCNYTTPTLQYYSSQTLSIFSLMTLFCVFVWFILQDIFIVLVSWFIINSLSDIVSM